MLKTLNFAVNCLTGGTVKYINVIDACKDTLNSLICTSQIHIHSLYASQVTQVSSQAARACMTFSCPIDITCGDLMRLQGIPI